MDKLLSDDHHAIGRILKQLLAALRKNKVAASYAKLDLLWARLAVHIRAEHLHLFPAVTRCSPDPSEAESLIEQLRADHDFFMSELAGAVNTLREQPDNSSDKTRLASVLKMILEIQKRLSKHNEIEEKQVYQLTHTLFSEPQQEELASRVKKELDNRPSRFSADAWANKS
jgi:hemerythrin superfamily protein